MTNVPSIDIELKRKIQLLKGSDGSYVVSTVTDLFVLLECIQEHYAQRESEAYKKGYIDGGVAQLNKGKD